MSRAKGQFQIRARNAILDLTSRRRFARSPGNALTRRVGRFDRQGAAGEAIAKQIAHVVPDLISVEIIRKDGLADVWFEDAVFHGRDFECDPARRGVAVEHFAVGSVFGELVGGPDGAADGPEVDGLVALVGYDGSA